MRREDALAAFLASHGQIGATPVKLAEDASFRRYWRLPGAVVMDAPPGQENLRPFLRLQRQFAAIGLSVPDVRAVDLEHGFLLLEDFGDDLFAALLDAAAAGCDGMICGKWTRDQLFDAATDALAALHAAAPPADLPAWHGAAMRQAAAATFLDWWWPARFGEAASQSIRADFDAALAALLAPLESLSALVHRDYFAGNLFWLPGRSGLRRVGIIDFQDAAIGHPAYDLASLVEDARRDLPASLAERQLRRYLDLRRNLDPRTFHDAYAAAAAHRHLRVAGLWVRLARRDGKMAYLQHGTRTWRLLEHALARPAAAPLAAFFDRWVPQEWRSNPL